MAKVGTGSFVATPFVDAAASLDLGLDVLLRLEPVTGAKFTALGPAAELCIAQNVMDRRPC